MVNFSAIITEKKIVKGLMACVFLALVCLLSTTTAAAQFGAATNYPVGSNPQGIASADFNNDARADLVIVNRGSDTVSLLLGNGDGTFGAATNFALIGLGVLSNVVVTDFNNDGNRDIAVGCGGGSRFFVLLGNGAGGFGAPITINAPGDAGFVAASDFNSDGNADIVFRSTNSPTISVLLGNGTGGFAAPITFTTSASALTIASGDFNNDNNRDLAIAVNNGAFSVAVHLGNGNGTFGTAANFSTADTGQIAVADFNQDGSLDIVTTSFLQQTVYLFTGNGAGSFTISSPFPAIANPQQVVAADFNGDGRPDIAVGSSATSNFAYLQNNGAGGFNAPLTFGTGSQPFTLVAGQFNEGGRLDIATANFAGNNVSVLFGAPPTAAGVTVGGRVLNAFGRGIRNARVTLTDSSGNSRTALTSSFGYYEFTGVSVGEFYTFSVRSSKYAFADPTRVRGVFEDVSDVDFIAEE